MMSRLPAYHISSKATLQPNMLAENYNLGILNKTMVVSMMTETTYVFPTDFIYLCIL